jgi:phosphoglycerate dehydrogenase-like enzyme
MSDKMATGAGQPVVFITEPMQDESSEFAVRKLREEGCEVRLGRGFTDAESIYSTKELCALVGDVEYLMVSSRELFSRQVMEAAPKLKSISKLGIGVERIDVAAATDLGILVSNTPIPENFLSVAEYAVAMILALAKGLKAADRNARIAGMWRSGRSVFMKGKTVGIVGLGRIGSRVAELLRPFDLRLVAFDPNIDQQRAASFGVELVDLDTLLRQSDFITLHAVVTADNRNLLGAREFALVKPSAYLVNVARGALVDEIALNAALREERLAGAALDVFEPEPPEPNSPLLSAELEARTLFSPHSAGMTPELIYKMPLTQLENTLSAVRGETPEYVVNRAVLPRWRRLHGT